VEAYKAGKLKVEPTTQDQAKAVGGAVAKESEKAAAKEQKKKVEAYEAGKLKVEPTTQDQAKAVGGAVAKESEKGTAPTAPPKK
jgi:predicted NodU family carbamoyl transferase